MLAPLLTRYHAHDALWLTRPTGLLALAAAAAAGQGTLTARSFMMTLAVSDFKRP